MPSFSLIKENKEIISTEEPHPNRHQRITWAVVLPRLFGRYVHPTEILRVAILVPPLSIKAQEFLDEPWFATWAKHPPEVVLSMLAHKSR